jgi:hypothetical protein
LEQSALRVHDETMGCFVAQTMEAVGQIEGLICSKPFKENLPTFWAVLVFKGLRSLVA